MRTLPVTADSKTAPTGGAGHLSLLGMPGSGKTTLGRALAAHFGLPFLDLDAAVVARAGQDVPAIFRAHGEAGFRALEAEVLRDVLARPEALVLATGGGTPCFHHNLAALQARSFTLWLDVPVPVLAARLAAAAETAGRPLLAAAGPPEKWLRETLAARNQFYAQALLHCPDAVASVAGLAARLATAGFAPLAAKSAPGA